MTELWRYPVKSMGGEKLEAVGVSALGFDGDRRWGIRDVVTGTILTARREPRLLFATAAVTDNGGVLITLPDGTQTDSGDDLSDWLGRQVAVVPAGDEGGTYEIAKDFETEANWTSWQGPPGALHDSKQARVSLVSTTTLRDWDVRRFRPNIVMDEGDEDALVGTSVQLGTCILNLEKQIARCVIVTRPQRGLERDLDILRTINRERDNHLAIGAVIGRAGQVRVGDQLTECPRPL